MWVEFTPTDYVYGGNGLVKTRLRENMGLLLPSLLGASVLWPELQVGKTAKVSLNEGS